MSSTNPGLQIFSPEWLTEAAPTIPDRWRPVVLEVCEAFQLGNSLDPLCLYEIMTRHLAGPPE